MSNTTIATMSVEVLNSSYLPLGNTSMARALALILRGAAVVEKADLTREIRSAGNVLAAPRAIRLVKFVDVPFAVAPEHFTRLGVLRRDDYTCGYCGERGNAQNMTHDHILPRSRGGLDEWMNAITACIRCNSIKADQTPEEAGMPLLFEPSVPYKMYLKSGKSRKRKRKRSNG
jgi:5-methylcytosine-specific restriction endonuclease McrA